MRVRELPKSKGRFVAFVGSSLSTLVYSTRKPTPCEMCLNLERKYRGQIIAILADSGEL